MSKVLMELVVAALVLCILKLVDRKIKGTKSIVTKVISVLFVGGFIGFFIYLNGSAILNLFRINFKSFNEVKGFVLKVLVLLLLMFIILSIFVSFFIKTVVLLKERNIKKGYSVVQESVEEVVFDSNDIPDIKDNFLHAKFLESINTIDGFSFSNLAKGDC